MIGHELSGSWRRSGRAIGVALTLLLCAGCAHTLEVKNLSLYKPEYMNSLGTDLRIGLAATTSTPEEDRLMINTVNALKRDGFKVTYPFYSSKENDATVDFVVKVATSSEYKGSGWNFLINWPGFLIWTPAWHGYNYRAVYAFDVDVMDTKTNASLPHLAIPVDLDIRHAAINRTWTELSWLEWSAIAFAGGIIFTRYDKSVTPLLVNAVESKVGDYVASKMELALSSALPQTAATTNAVAPASAPAIATEQTTASSSP